MERVVVLVGTLSLSRDARYSGESWLITLVPVVEFNIGCYGLQLANGFR